MRYITTNIGSIINRSFVVYFQFSFSGATEPGLDDAHAVLISVIISLSLVGLISSTAVTYGISYFLTSNNGNTNRRIEQFFIDKMVWIRFIARSTSYFSLLLQLTNFGLTQYWKPENANISEILGAVYGAAMLIIILILCITERSAANIHEPNLVEPVVDPIPFRMRSGSYSSESSATDEIASTSSSSITIERWDTVAMRKGDVVRPVQEVPEAQLVVSEDLDCPFLAAAIAQRDYHWWCTVGGWFLLAMWCWMWLLPALLFGPPLAFGYYMLYCPLLWSLRLLRLLSKKLLG